MKMKCCKRIICITFVIMMLMSFSLVTFAEASTLSNTASSSRNQNKAAWEAAYEQIINSRFLDEEKDPDACITPSHYTLTDINKDGVPELILGLRDVSYSSSMIYTFSSGNARLIGEVEDGHGFFASIPVENGVLFCYEGQGHIRIELWEMDRNSLTSRILYDERYDGGFPYPYPNAYYRGARVLPECRCNDYSGLTLYGILSGPSWYGSDDGRYPDNDKDYYLKFLNGPMMAQLTFVNKDVSPGSPAYSMFERYGKGASVRGDELLSVLSQGTGQTDFWIDSLDVNGDGQLDAVVYPDGWDRTYSHSSPGTELFPLILSEQNGKVYAYVNTCADVYNERAFFCEYVDQMGFNWPFQLYFDNQYCCRVYLPESSYPNP